MTLKFPSSMAQQVHSLCRSTAVRASSTVVDSGPGGMESKLAGVESKKSSADPNVLCYLKMAEKLPIGNSRREDYLNRAVGHCCMRHWQAKQGEAAAILPKIKLAYQSMGEQSDASRKVWDDFNSKTQSQLYLGGLSGKG